MQGWLRRGSAAGASTSRRDTSAGASRRGGRAKKKTKTPAREDVLKELESVRKEVEEQRRRRGLALKYDLPAAPAPLHGGPSGSISPLPGGPGKPPKSALDLLSKEELYSQVAEVRRQLSTRLSDTNRYVRHLEVDLLKRDEEIASHHDKLGAIEEGFGHVLRTTRELREGVMAQLDRGGDSGEGRALVDDRLRILESCVEDLAKALADESESLSLSRKKPISISWLGSAQDVKLMGSFDGWTNGEQLSPDHDYAGGGIAEFSGEVLLRPGVYEVKFLVDGRWQLMPEWPTSGSDPVSSNNILVVE